jgi:hypothetical protein
MQTQNRIQERRAVRTTVDIASDVWIYVNVQKESRRLSGERTSLNDIINRMLRAAMELSTKKDR